MAPEKSNLSDRNASLRFIQKVFSSQMTAQCIVILYEKHYKFNIILALAVHCVCIRFTLRIGKQSYLYLLYIRMSGFQRAYGGKRTSVTPPYSFSTHPRLESTHSWKYNFTLFEYFSIKLHLSQRFGPGYDNLELRANL